MLRQQRYSLIRFCQNKQNISLVTLKNHHYNNYKESNYKESVRDFSCNSNNKYSQNHSQNHKHNSNHHNNKHERNHGQRNNSIFTLKLAITTMIAAFVGCSPFLLVSGEEAKKIEQNSKQMCSWLAGIELLSGNKTQIESDESNQHLVAIVKLKGIQQNAPGGHLNTEQQHMEPETETETKTKLLQKYLEILYDGIENKVGLAVGADLPEKEEDEIDATGGSSAYGEITFEGVETLMSFFGPKDGFVFYDLG